MISTLKLERVISLVCTEVIRYNISTASIRSSAITIFAQEVPIISKLKGEGAAGEDGVKL